MTEENKNNIQQTPLKERKKNHMPDDSFKNILKDFYEAAIFMKNDGIIGKFVLTGGSIVIAACAYMAASATINEVRSHFFPKAEQTAPAKISDGERIHPKMVELLDVKINTKG